MLDSLLYEPGRRRIAMWVLLSLLVLAVGFVALGTLVGGLGVLTVFGVAFLGAAIAFLAKLLVVSHVHIRGTAGRLEALNDRYDQTSRWLEGFDADTRESFLAAGKRLDQADADRIELLSDIEKLTAESARVEALSELQSSVDRRLAELEAQTGERIEAIGKATEARASELAESIGRSVSDAEERAREAIEASGSSIREHTDSMLGEFRAELEAISKLAERLGEAESRLEQAAGETDRLGAEMKSTFDSLLGEVKEQVEDKLRLVNGRVTKFNDEHERKRKNAAQAVREQATAAIDELRKRVDDASQLAARQRGDGYVQFPRLISGRVSESAAAFGVKVSPAELKYLERKLQVLEGICEGRLAGSVDDAIGRVLAGRMVRGKEIKILEIGVLFGIGAVFMHHALVSRFERVHLSLLDPFDGYYGKDHLDPLTGLPVTRAAVERNLTRCGIPAADYEFLEGFSTDDTILAAAEAGGPYHVVVIDGDHSAEGIKADFERYAELVRGGGTLVIDDYGSEDWPAVTAFVDAVVRGDDRFKLVGVLGKSAVFKRRGSASPKSARAKASTKRENESSVDTNEQRDGASDSEQPAEVKSRQASPKPAKSVKKTKAKASARPAAQAEESASEPPVPVVTTRTKKAKAGAARASSKRADASADAG